MAIEVATFEQISVILSKLATNYSGIVNNYYDIFFNPVPMDVQLQMYNEDGTLVTLVVPNRAKDKSYIYSGNGAPEGVQRAEMGSTYQDLTSGSLYVKQVGNDEYGWSELIDSNKLRDIILQGSGSPEGVALADKGSLYVDILNSGLYIKTTSTSNTGWSLISTNTDLLANSDLSNLTSIGLAQFANPDLSNLSSIGKTVLNEKEEVGNKVDVINDSTKQSSSLYPTTKATYAFVESEVNERADRDLSNLKDSGEWDHFINYSQVRDCIKYAPNGLPSIFGANGNSFIFPEGLVFIGASGVDNNRCKVNVTSEPLANELTLSLTENGEFITEPDTDYIVFYDHKTKSIKYTKSETFFIQKDKPTTFEGIWYCDNYVDDLNKECNWYHCVETDETGTTGWVQHVMTEVLRFSTDEFKAPKADYVQYKPLTVLTDSDLCQKIKWGFIKGHLRDQDDLAEAFDDKVNINADNLTEDGKKVFDGAWVASNVDFDEENVTLGEYTIDLAEYLPTDAQTSFYEVSGAIETLNENDSLTFVRTTLTNSTLGTPFFKVIQKVNNSSQYSYTPFTAIIPANELKLTKKISLETSDPLIEGVTTCTVHLFSYRRVGSNN